ncbi:YcxB family protein [Streptomyces sp. NBC_01013]|uniref:YcxB family protein n=1 Tax=Streptomyces sp. NBC_01013 TaxID=2903718 RepID=UPI00386827C7|nr:YcxB family protein [Streptomyces sp. NBC_01013]
MSEQQGAVHGAVDLRYRPVLQDYSAALRARNRVGSSGRRQRILGVVTTGCGVVAASLSLAEGTDVPVLMLVALLVSGPLLLLSPWLMARQLFRFVGRQGEFRVRVEESGVSIDTDHSSGVIKWQAQPRYVETADLFVMLSDDKNATALTVIAKRGVQDRSDVDRLREIFDRHLTKA